MAAVVEVLALVCLPALTEGVVQFAATDLALGRRVTAVEVLPLDTRKWMAMIDRRAAACCLYEQ
jgi:hypothetical protein